MMVRSIMVAAARQSCTPVKEAFTVLRVASLDMALTSASLATDDLRVEDRRPRYADYAVEVLPRPVGPGVTEGGGDGDELLLRLVADDVADGGVDMRAHVLGVGSVHPAPVVPNAVFPDDLDEFHIQGS